MFEIALLLIFGVIFALMNVRLTEKPIRVPFGLLTEDAANTFTTATISLPGVPSIALARGKNAKAIGVEVMKCVSSLSTPDPEPGQANRMIAQIVKGSTPTTLLSINDTKSVWKRDDEVHDSQAGAVGNTVVFGSRVRHDDLTDGDGNGEPVLDNIIHLIVQGIGNGNAKSIEGYLLVHLTDFDSQEAVFEMLEAAGS